MLQVKFQLASNDSDTSGRLSTFGLINGGLAGLVWRYLIVWIDYLLMFASIAEMSSM